MPVHIIKNNKIHILIFPDGVLIIKMMKVIRTSQNSTKFPLPPIFTSAALCILGTQPAQSPRIPPSAKIFANA